MRRQNIPLFIIELGFPGQSFAVPDSFQLSGRDVMWHKERLLNIAINRLPAHFTKVAWIDADVVFPDDRWYGWASQLLDVFDLIQLFDRLDQQDNDGRFVRQLNGLAAYVAAGRPAPFKFDTSATWPGLAWAAKRELLAAHGLLDRFVLGGADTYMSLAAFNVADSWSGWHVQQLAPKLGQFWRDWATPFYADVQARVGYLPTTVIQLGHGTTANRHYVDRMEILSKYDFDPAVDVATDDHGVWKWASPKSELHSAVSRYFDQRQEDSIGVEVVVDVA
jgi:hypothetical protein